MDVEQPKISEPREISEAEILEAERITDNLCWWLHYKAAIVVSERELAAISLLCGRRLTGRFVAVYNHVGKLLLLQFQSVPGFGFRPTTRLTPFLERLVCRDQNECPANRFREAKALALAPLN